MNAAAACEVLVTCRCGLRHPREMECPICSAPRGDVELVLRLPRGGANAERVARLVSDLASIVGASVVVRRAGSDRVTRIGPQPMLCADCGADVHADWYIGRDGRRRCLRCHAVREAGGTPAVRGG